MYDDTTSKEPGGCTGAGFRPGVSGNPSGSSRLARERRGITEAIRERLTPDRASAIAERLLSMAENGDARAIKILLDRVDGPIRHDADAPGGLAGLIEVLKTPVRDYEESDSAQEPASSPRY